MKELLARLKKADPKTYGEWISMDGVFPQEGYELSDTELDCLQGTIQRAIEAKPDGWRVSTWNENGIWMALIRLPGGYTNMNKCFGEESDSPAEAILSAYLQALEAING